MTPESQLKPDPSAGYLPDDTDFDVSAGYVDDLPTPKPTSLKDKALARAREVGLPEDLVSNIGQQESGWEHFTSGGGVKMGPVLPSGRRAIGAMQVVEDQPGSRKRTIGDRTYNLADEDDNIEAGINYLLEGHQKSGGDPKLTSLYYFGGPGALQRAQKTGRIPNISDKTSSTPGTSANTYVNRAARGVKPNGNGTQVTTPDLSAGYVDEPVESQSPDVSAGYVDEVQQPQTPREVAQAAIAKANGQQPSTVAPSAKPTLQPDANGRVSIAEMPGVEVRPEQARALGYSIAGDQPPNGAAGLPSQPSNPEYETAWMKNAGEYLKGVQQSGKPITATGTTEPFYVEVDDAGNERVVVKPGAGITQQQAEAIVAQRNAEPQGGGIETSDADLTPAQRAERSRMMRSYNQIDAVNEEAALMRGEQYKREVDRTFGRGTWDKAGNAPDPYEERSAMVQAALDRRAEREYAERQQRALTTMAKARTPIELPAPGGRGAGMARAAAAEEGRRTGRPVIENRQYQQQQRQREVNRLFVSPQEQRANAIANEERNRSGPGLASPEERIASRLRSEGLVRDTSQGLSDQQIAALEGGGPVESGSRIAYQPKTPFTEAEKARLRSGQTLTGAPIDAQSMQAARILAQPTPNEREGQHQDWLRAKQVTRTQRDTTMLDQFRAQTTAEQQKAQQPGPIAQEAIDNPNIFNREYPEQEAQKRYQAWKSNQDQIDRDQDALTPEDWKQIDRMRHSFVQDSGLYRWADIGKQDFMRLAPDMATGITKVLADVTGSQKVREAENWMRKTINKRMIASDLAKADLSTPESLATSSFEFLGNIFNVVGGAALVGPEAAMGGEAGLSTLGRTGSYKQGLTRGAVGTAIGTLGRFTPYLEPYRPSASLLQKAANIGTDVTTTAVGTYGLERAAGTPEPEARKAALVNGAAVGLMRMTQIIPDVAKSAAKEIVRSNISPNVVRDTLARFTDFQRATFVEDPSVPPIGTKFQPEGEVFGAPEPEGIPLRRTKEQLRKRAEQLFTVSETQAAQELMDQSAQTIGDRATRAFTVYGDPETKGTGGNHIDLDTARQYADRGRDSHPVFSVNPVDYEAVVRAVRPDLADQMPRTPSQIPEETTFGRPTNIAPESYEEATAPDRARAAREAQENPQPESRPQIDVGSPIAVGPHAAQGFSLRVGETTEFYPDRQSAEARIQQLRQQAAQPVVDSKEEALDALKNAHAARDITAVQSLAQMAMDRGATEAEVESALAEAPTAPPSSATPRVAESQMALTAQARAMMQGRGNRKAVIFTEGEGVPDTEGIANIGSIRGPNGEHVIFRSDKITPAEVMKAMYEGRSNELTGMVNPESPDATVAAVAKGQDGKERWAGYITPQNIEAFKKEAEAQFGEYGPLTFDFGGRETEKQILENRTKDAKQDQLAGAQQPASQAGAETPQVASPLASQPAIPQVVPPSKPSVSTKPETPTSPALGVSADEIAAERSTRLEAQQRARQRATDRGEDVAPYDQHIANIQSGGIDDEIRDRIAARKEREAAEAKLPNGYPAIHNGQLSGVGTKVPEGWRFQFQSRLNPDIVAVADPAKPNETLHVDVTTLTPEQRASLEIPSASGVSEPQPGQTATESQARQLVNTLKWNMAKAKGLSEADAQTVIDKSIDFNDWANAKSEARRQGYPLDQASRVAIDHLSGKLPAIPSAGSSSDPYRAAPSLSSSEPTPQQFQHRDFGLVTESADQSGVAQTDIRVTDEKGNPHVILHPKGNGIGNALAIPVKETEAPAPHVEPDKEIAISPQPATDKSPTLRSAAEVAKSYIPGIEEQRRKADDQLRGMINEVASRPQSKRRVSALRQEFGNDLYNEGRDYGYILEDAGHRIASVSKSARKFAEQARTEKAAESTKAESVPRRKAEQVPPVVPAERVKEWKSARVGDLVEHSGKYVEIVGRDLREAKAQQITGKSGGEIIPEPDNPKRFAVVKPTEYAAPVSNNMVSFPAEMDSLGIPRAAMPQVDLGHRGAMVQYLKGRGVDWDNEDIAPDKLKPSQAEYNPAKVEKARDWVGPERRILISDDDRVLDGHHQWLRKLEDAPDEPIPVIRLHQDAQTLLMEMREFPSSYTDGTHHETEAHPLDRIQKVLDEAGQIKGNTFNVDETKSPTELRKISDRARELWEQYYGEENNYGKDLPERDPSRIAMALNALPRRIDAYEDDLKSVGKDVTESSVPPGTLAYYPTLRQFTGDLSEGEEEQLTEPLTKEMSDAALAELGVTPMRPEDIFPAPSEPVSMTAWRNRKPGAPDALSESEARARIEEWKAFAKRVGEEEDHSNEVILSLYDRTGQWSQPYRDAGYTVIQYDITKTQDDDLIEHFPIGDISDVIKASGKIIGVLAAPPCTSFTVSGAHSWAKQHDLPSEAMLEKKYGWWAPKHFDTPLEYAKALVHAAQAVVEFANPSEFHVLENPIGRMPEVTGLPKKPTLSFDPNDYGDPYTKRTLLWGKFNPNLPTALVDPVEGTKMTTKLTGFTPESKALRSETPEGFAYAFFIANNTSKLKPATTLATTEKLFVQIGQRQFPFTTLEDVSRRWEYARDEAGIGASDSQWPVIVNKQGEVVAHISYNGRIWEGKPEDWTDATPLLYESREEQPHAETVRGDQGVISGKRETAGRGEEVGKHDLHQEGQGRKPVKPGEVIASGQTAAEVAKGTEPEGEVTHVGREPVSGVTERSVTEKEGSKGVSEPSRPAAEVVSSVEDLAAQAKTELSKRVRGLSPKIIEKHANAIAEMVVSGKPDEKILKVGKNREVYESLQQQPTPGPNAPEAKAETPLPSKPVTYPPAIEAAQPVKTETTAPTSERKQDLADWANRVLDLIRAGNPSVTQLQKLHDEGRGYSEKFGVTAAAARLPRMLTLLRTAIDRATPEAPAGYRVNEKGFLVKTRKTSLQAAMPVPEDIDLGTTIKAANRRQIVVANLGNGKLQVIHEESETGERLRRAMDLGTVTAAMFEQARDEAFPATITDAVIVNPRKAPIPSEAEGKTLGELAMQHKIKVDKDKYNKGELANLPLRVRDNKNGLSLEDAANFAAVEGYGWGEWAEHDETTGFVTDMWGYLSALEDDLSGIRKSYSTQYQPDELAQPEYEQYVKTEQDAHDENAIVSLLENEASGQLYDKIRDGSANESDLANFRHAAEDLGISAEAANNLFDTSTSTESVPAVGESKEAGFEFSEPAESSERIEPVAEVKKPFPITLAKRLLALPPEQQATAYGPSNKYLRREIYFTLTGEKPTDKTTGSMAISKLIADHFGIERKGKAPSQIEDAIVRELESVVAPTKPPVTALHDVGEKIGGARKDLAASTGPAAERKAKEETPAWARRFEVSEITKSTKPEEEGKWAIYDTKHTDWAGQPRALSGLYDSKEDAEAYLPIAAVAIKHRVWEARKEHKDDPTKFEIYRKIGDRKMVKVVDKQFDNRDDAMKYMALHAGEILEVKTSFGEEILPRPDNVTREGKVRRTTDATPEMFRQAFGLRAVEFGNWNNQIERQEVVNFAFDSLADLAEILNIPPRAIGLNGELALAFGARGHGLTSARAHYERNYGVINLTKMSGAGSLAHEFFHALDHYFGRLSGKAKAERVANEKGNKVFPASSAAGDMVTHGFPRDNKARVEIKDAYDELVKTMFKKAETYVEDTQRVEKFLKETREEVRKGLESIRDGKYGGLSVEMGYGKRFIKPASAEQLAEFDRIAKTILDGEAISTEWRTMPGKGRMSFNGRWTNDALERLSEIYKAVRGRSGFNSEQTGTLDDLRKRMRLYDDRLKMLASAQKGEEKIKMVPTSYAMEAKGIDQGRVEDYWLQNHEMAARAFQAYVEDKLSENGGHNDFLTYGTNLAVFTPWGWKQPFPRGDERVAINKAFDKLVTTLKTKETEVGTTLFGRYSSPQQLGFVQEGLTMQEAPRSAAGVTREHLLKQQREDAEARRANFFGENYKPLVALQEPDVASDVRRLARSIQMRVQDQVRSAQGASAEDVLPRELPDVIRSLQKLAELRRTHTTVSDYLDQLSLFGARDTTPEQDDILKALDTNGQRYVDQILPPPAETEDAQSAMFARDTRTDTPEFRNWFQDSKVVDEDGEPQVVYTGHYRADQVGNKFRKSRASSGPMPYFTDDPEIAGGYAAGKTYIPDDDSTNYQTWFSYQPPNSKREIKLGDAWRLLSPEERASLTKNIPRVSHTDEEGEELPNGTYRLAPEGQVGLMSRDGWDRYIRDARGNMFEAATEAWLTSGALFDQEEEFLDVLKTAGVNMSRVAYTPPTRSQPGIFPVYLKIQRPFDTANAADVVKQLDAASRRSRSGRASEYVGDMWHKRRSIPSEWMAELRRDIADGSTNAWTTVPDWVTRELQRLGYDGIKDTGGKHGGQQHVVWIPFEPQQIKSAISPSPEGSALFARAIEYRSDYPGVKQPWEMTREELSKDYNEQFQVPNNARAAWVGKLPPEGSWRMDPSTDALEQLQRVPLEDLTTAEDESDPGIQSHVQQYTEWTKGGHQAPPINLVKHVKGHWVSINRRRVMAARRAGEETILAWVSDSSPSGRAIPTHEDVVRQAVAEGRSVPAEVLAEYPSTAQFQRAFHGSPHQFDKFDISKIGTGEGAQSYGHGLYFSDKKEIADYYRKNLSKTHLRIETKDGKDYTDSKFFDAFFTPQQLASTRPGLGGTVETIPDLIVSTVKASGYDLPKARGVLRERRDRERSFSPAWDFFEDAREALRVMIHSGITASPEPAGRTYEVELAPKEDEYLDWDKPLAQQSETVKTALKDASYEIKPSKYPSLKQAERLFQSPRVQYDGRSDIGIRESLNKGYSYVQQGDSAGFHRWFDQKGGLLSPGRRSDRTGEEFYHDVQYQQRVDDHALRLDESAKAASQHLHSLGIRGIRYRDAESRDLQSLPPYEVDQQGDKFWAIRTFPAGVGIRTVENSSPFFDTREQAQEWADKHQPEAPRPTYNYVIFSDDDVAITAQFARHKAREATGKPEFRVEGHRIALNEPARWLMLDAYGLNPRYNITPDVSGATESNSNSLISVLDELADNEPDRAEDIERFITAVREAAESGKPIELFTDRARWHERVHGAQHEGSGDAAIDQHLTPKGFDRLEARPEYNQINQGLEAKGEKGSRAVKIAEAAAYLADGHLLGLDSVDEAVAWLADYIDAFAEKNGYLSINKFREAIYESQGRLQNLERAITRAEETGRFAGRSVPGLYDRRAESAETVSGGEGEEGGVGGTEVSRTSRGWLPDRMLSSREARGGRADVEGSLGGEEQRGTQPSDQGVQREERRFTSSTTEQGRERDLLDRESATEFGRQSVTRSFPIPPEAAEPIASYRNSNALKSHPKYKAAKAGDVVAAHQLVNSLVSSASLAEAKKRLPSNAIFQPIIAEEASGTNALPSAIADHYAVAVGGTVGTEIVQANQVFHTGANAMERLVTRPVFEGDVEQGRPYVLVDDVSTLGGTLAEASNYIQSQGGKVVGVILLANASRTASLAPSKKLISSLEARYGQTIRDEFNVEPSALTAAEAGYLIGFKNADTLRDRAAKAKGENLRREVARTPPQDRVVRQTDTPEFKRWFKRSAVAYPNGDPLPVFHWTDNEFEAFDMERTGGMAHFGTEQAALDRGGPQVGIGYEIEKEDDSHFWVYADSGPKSGEDAGPFASEAEAKAFIKTQPKTIEPDAYYLSIQNPLRVPDFGIFTFDALRSWLNTENIISDAEATRAWNGWQKTNKEGWKVLNSILEKHGYDGLVYTNEQEDVGSDSYVALHPEQIKSVNNFGKWSPSNPNILMAREHPFANEPRTLGGYFYSQLYRAIDAKMPNKASAEQVRAIIANPQSGVKPDEIAWTGFSDWLDNQQGTITKNDALDYLRANNVDVKEIQRARGGVLSGEAEQLAEELYKTGYRVRWVPEGAGSTSEIDSVEGPEFKQDLNEYTKERTRGEYSDYQKLIRELPNLAERVMQEYEFKTGNHAKVYMAGDDFEGMPEPERSIALELADKGSRAMTEEPKFANYVVPGEAENYREILLTLPDLKGAPPPEELTELPEGYELIHDPMATPDRKWAIIPPGQIHARPFYGSHPSKDAATAAAIEHLNYLRQEEWKKNRPEFTAGHFDESNVLVHARVDDRETTDGKKVLFTNEVQSDWFQRARKFGFRDAEWEAKKARGEVRDGDAVPLAPFYKTWPELAMRNLLLKAVEGGYDHLAWLTGDQANDLYDLSKHIDSIKYAQRETRDGYFITATKDGKEVLRQDVPTGELDEFVGKDVAAKIVAGEGAVTGIDPTRSTGELSGLDLKVGGKGMKGFYDKIIPDYMRKLGKKWGAEVSDVSIPSEEQKGAEITGGQARRMVEQGEKVWAVYTNGPSEDRNIVSSTARLSALTDTDPGNWQYFEAIEHQTVHAINITPAMKKSVMEGLPLFARLPEGESSLEDILRQLREEAEPLSRPEGEFPAGIKNRQTDQERADLGLDPVIIQAQRDIPTVFRAAQAEFEPTRAANFAQTMAEHPRPLIAEETAGMIIYKTWLKNEYAGTTQKLRAAQDAGDVQAQRENRHYLADLDERLLTYQDMARRTGYEQGLGLRLRVEMMNQDYSLAEVRMRAFALGAGEENENGQMVLPAELEKRIADLVDERDRAVEALKKYDEEAAQRAAEAELRRQKAERDAKRKAEKDKEKQQVKVVTRIVQKDKLDQEFEELSRGLDALIMTRFSANPFLDPDVLRFLKRMTRNRVEAGANTVEDWINPIWERVRGKIAGGSERDLRDALSGYGKVIMPTRDELDARIAELKTLARDVSAIEDIEQGERPLRTGLQRRKPTQRERESRKRIAAALRKYNIQIERNEPSSEEKQKSALDRAKTVLQNRIEDLNAYISGREVPTAQEAVKLSDPELDALRTERDRLQEVWDDIKKQTGATDDEKIRRAERSVAKSIEDYEKKITKGATAVKRKAAEPWSPQLGKLRQQQSELRDQLNAMRKADEGRRRDLLKRYLDRRTAELNQQIASGNYEKKARPLPPRDPEIDAKRARVKRAEDKIEHEMKAIKMKNRGKLEKLWFDVGVAGRRAVALSSTWVLGKLTVAAYARIFLSIGEEVLGGGLSHLPVLKQVAARAPSEGRLSVSAERKAIVTAFSQHMLQQMGQALKTGKLDIDVNWGGKSPYDLPVSKLQVGGKTVFDTKWFEFIGHMHMALKTPAKIHAFERYMEKNLEWFHRYGWDETDEGVIALAAARALVDANRAIFQQSNLVSDLFSASTRFLMKYGDKDDDKVKMAVGRTAAGILRMLYPVTRVPPNFVTEALNYTPVGGAVAIGKLVYGAIAYGLNPPPPAPPGLPPGQGTGGYDPYEGGLPPELADSIFRGLKKSGIGLLMFALALLSAFGLFGMDNVIKFGGYYRRGAKRSEEDVPFGGIRLMGIDLPPWATHVPIFEVGQMVQTAAEIYRESHDIGEDTESVPAALVGAGLGILSEVPFMEEPGRAFAALESGKSGARFIGETLRGFTIPPDVQRMARVWDPEQPTTGWDKFWQLAGVKRIHAEPRKPQGGFLQRIGQEYELGVPGLRKRVGEDIDKKRLKAKDRFTDDFRSLKQKIGNDRYQAVLDAPLGDASAWNTLSTEEQDAWTKATAQVVSAVQNGTLLPNDPNTIARDAQLTPFQLHFQKKKIADAMDAYAKMPPENQSLVRQLLINKGPEIKNLRVTEQDAATKRFKELTEQDPANRVRSRSRRMFERLEQAAPQP